MFRMLWAFFTKQMNTSKYLYRWLTTSILTLALSGAAHAATQAALPTLAPMLEKVMPAVVNIATKETIEVSRRAFPFPNDPFFRRFFDFPEFQHPGGTEERQRSGAGSGVIINADEGYIITNAHVVKAADDIYVSLDDGRRFKAKVIGIDEDVDIAVIQIDAKDLVEIPIGDSEKLRVGDFVIAIGNPFRLNHTVTLGIVSALGRSGLGIESYEDFIQTDASINPGNSGGALVNLQGQLVGINTAILGANRNIGIGFAIPVDMATNITEQLIEYGEVQRGRLGVVVQTLTPDLAEAFGLKQEKGVVITEVEPGSAAEAAGIEPGDIVLSVNEKRVENGSDMRNYIGVLRFGSEVRLEILRENKKRTIVAKISKRKQMQMSGERFDKRLNGTLLTANDPSAKRPGIKVAEIKANSFAHLNGLRQGDLIVSVNRHAVEDFDELKKVIRADQPLLIKILRGDHAMFLVLRS